MKRVRLRFSGFDWDEGNIEKCGKHGVTLAEIERMLETPVLLVDDPAHSATEIRQCAIGATEAGRDLFVSFTLRERAGRSLVRPISARYMHRPEVNRYGQTPSRSDQ